MREKRRVASIIVHSGRPDQNGWDIAALFTHYALGVDLGFTIGKRLRVQRPVFADTLPGSRWGMDQHAAGEYELPDIKRTQRSDETLGAADRHSFVIRVRLARQIEVRGQMND